MIRVTRRYRFSASHRLHSTALCRGENRTHLRKVQQSVTAMGTTIVLEVTRCRAARAARPAGSLDLGVLDGLVRPGGPAMPFDHQNLNAEVAEFPTRACRQRRISAVEIRPAP